MAEAKTEGDEKAYIKVGNPSALERKDSKEESYQMSPSSLSREDSKAEGDRSSPHKLKHEIVNLVMEFATSSDFEKAFELFTEENKNTFVPSMFDLGPNDEHPMAWHECYLDYLKTFEAKIEHFIENRGFIINEFYDQARDILEDDEVYGEAKFSLKLYSLPVSMNISYSLLRPHSLNLATHHL